jgi:hypothetical protein
VLLALCCQTCTFEVLEKRKKKKKEKKEDGERRGEEKNKEEWGGEGRGEEKRGEERGERREEEGREEIPCSGIIGDMVLRIAARKKAPIPLNGKSGVIFGEVKILFTCSTSVFHQNIPF